MASSHTITGLSVNLKPHHEPSKDSACAKLYLLMHMLSATHAPASTARVHPTKKKVESFMVAGCWFALPATARGCRVQAGPAVLVRSCGAVHVGTPRAPRARERGAGREGIVSFYLPLATMYLLVYETGSLSKRESVCVERRPWRRRSHGILVTTGQLWRKRHTMGAPMQWWRSSLGREQTSTHGERGRRDSSGISTHAGR